jgi:dTDP-L-rhamnose 4-epimerase
MKHVLITGGAGFIGRHLTRVALGNGHRVTVLDNLSPQVHGSEAQFDPPESVRFHQGDVTVRHDLETVLPGIDTIVHLAAETGTGQSMYEIDHYYRVNVQGTALLFDILANRNNSVSNVVLASSRSVYGEGAYLCRSCDPVGKRCYPMPRSPAQLAAHQWTPTCPHCDGPLEATATREEDQLAPASIYAATKLAQEGIVAVACAALGISHSILRFQNVFGEGQSLSNPYTGLLSIFSTRIRLGLPLPIFEDGKESRDFVHVEDVANAVLACVEQPREGVTLNVGLGKSVAILTVAQQLCSIMGSNMDPHVTGQYRVGDIRHNFADISRLKGLTGFHPVIGLREGLERFCNWVAMQPVPPDLLDRANEELKSRNLMG